MKKRKENKKMIISLGLMTFFLFSLTGCKFFQEEENQDGQGNKGVKKTGSLLKFVKQDVSPESFFSSETPLVLIFDQSDEEQNKKLESLVSNFSVLPGGKTFKKSITDKLKEFGFDFDNDIKPLLGEKPRVALSFEKISAEEENEDKGIVLSTKLADTERYAEFK